MLERDLRSEQVEGRRRERGERGGRGRSRSHASGASSAARITAISASQPGADRSGLSCSAVQIALAWISGPAIRWLEAVEVWCTSCSVGAEAPTTTILPASVAGPTRPERTSEYEYGVGSRRGAAEVDPRAAVVEAVGATGWPSARRRRPRGSGGPSSVAG